MTKTTDMQMSGEARLKARRNRIFALCGLAFVVSAGFGFATGYLGDLFRDGTLPGWILVLAWALAIAAFSWFCIAYFRQVDELDVLDNLWATLIGFYFYALALPSWFLFHDLGMVGAPNHIAIYLGAWAVMLLAYTIRKLGFR